MPSSNSSKSSKSSQSPPTTRTPRTRTGCWACRDRSVKCDEARPRCRRCQKTNLTCHYGIRLQWLEDSVARGIRHGRQGVWRPKQKDVTRDACTPTTLLEGRFQESPGSAKYRARSKGVVYFLNTFSKDIQLYWNSQGFRDILNDIALLEGDHAEEDDSINQSLITQASVEGRYKPHLVQYGGGSRTFPWKLATPVGRNISFTHQLARFDEFIPRYYTEVVCANASLVDARHYNPFRYHIVPMASHSSTVFSAMLAVSAVKMAAKDPKFHRRALVHRHRVLVDVKRILESDHIDTAKCLEALVAVVMLCWYDISDNCKSTWISHLVGIFGLLDVCLEQNICSADYEGILHFGQQYLMYHLIMAKSTLHVDDVIPSYKHILTKLLGSPATTYKGRNNTNYAGVEGPHNEVSRTMSSTYGNGDSTAQRGFRLVGPSFNEELDKIDTHQGFSNRLLLIINDICDLRDAQNSDEPSHQDADMEALERRVIEIQSKLDTLTQVPPENTYQNSEADIDRDTRRKLEKDRVRSEFITMTADSNRLAALLFLDETCATHLPHIVPQCRKSRSAIIQKILSYVKTICETGPITAALPIWPVFVAGCMASTDDDRLQVMEIFDMFLSEGKFGSLPPALTVIQMVWRQRDLGCDENPRKILFVSSGDFAGCCDGKDRAPTSPTSRKQRTRYPWERAISMLGGSSLLSLT